MGVKKLNDTLRTEIQEAFADAYTVEMLAKIYSDIQVECEKQLVFIASEIQKEWRNKNA